MPHPFTDNAIIYAFLLTGADGRAALENLREMRNHGTEYRGAADTLERYVEHFEKHSAHLALARGAPTTEET